MGNAYLKWAFAEATLLLIREQPEIKELHKKLKNKHGKARALAIISHKLGRAVYYMLKNKQAFDMIKFITVKLQNICNNWNILGNAFYKFVYI